MEHFSFGPLTPSDIASVIGVRPIDVVIRDDGDDDIEIETPDLSNAQRTMLTDLVTTRFLVWRGNQVVPGTVTPGLLSRTGNAILRMIGRAQ